MASRAVGGVLCALALTLAATGCSDADVTDTPTLGTVSDSPNAADTGCLDEPGTVAATPSEWYRDDASGIVALVGDSPEVPSDRLAPFADDATAAVAEHIWAIPRASSREFTRAGCATHRYATFDFGQGTIVVSAWRVEHAAQPGWIPNEGAFVADGDHLLVSTGPHLVVALAVAPDGTTVRVAAYGVGQLEAVAGWPTTMPQPPGAPPPGPAPATVEQMAAVATAVLQQVTDR